MPVECTSNAWRKGCLVKLECGGCVVFRFYLPHGHRTELEWEHLYLGTRFRCSPRYVTDISLHCRYSWTDGAGLSHSLWKNICNTDFLVSFQMQGHENANMKKDRTMVSKALTSVACSQCYQPLWKSTSWEFPGGPVVKNVGLSLLCLRFDPWSRNCGVTKNAMGVTKKTNKQTKKNKALLPYGKTYSIIFPFKAQWQITSQGQWHRTSSVKLERWLPRTFQLRYSLTLNLVSYKLFVFYLNSLK